MIQVIPELIEVQGRKRVKLALYDGRTIVDADVVDPLNSASRRKVARRLAERSGEPHAAERIEQVVLDCIGLIDQEEAAEAPTETPAGNIGLARPELILTPQVVALSVAEVVIRDREAVGRWRLYLRFADGRRESRPMPERVELEDGQSLWITPQPPPPPPASTVAWSMAGRERWLAGKEGPRPRDVFLKLCAAFEEFLDLPDEERRDGVESDGVTESNADAAAPSLLHPVTPLPSPTAALLSLWTMLTYAYIAWDAVPYLYLGGPAGSGKTRVFEIMSRLAYRVLGSSNLSAPALFRTLHDRGGTLLLDEAERLSEGSPEVAELRSILLAGYKRGGRASRLESVGESNFQMTEFAVFGPKAIACINYLEGPLATRCIPIQMFRSSPDSPKPRRRLDADPQRWIDLRDDLHALALGELGLAAPALANQADVCPLAGRNYELWQPILALAAWVDQDGQMNLASRLLELARRLIDENREQLVPEIDLIVLRVLAAKLAGDEEPTCETLLYGARRINEQAFRRISAGAIGKLIRRYKFVTRKNKSDQRVVTLDQLAHVADVEARFGVELKPTRMIQFALGRAY